MRARTKAGLDAARERGRVGGRAKMIPWAAVKKAYREVQAGRMSVAKARDLVPSPISSTGKISETRLRILFRQIEEGKAP